MKWVPVTQVQPPGSEEWRPRPSWEGCSLLLKGDVRVCNCWYMGCHLPSPGKELRGWVFCESEGFLLQQLWGLFSDF